MGRERVETAVKSTKTYPRTNSDEVSTGDGRLSPRMKLKSSLDLNNGQDIATDDRCNLTLRDSSSNRGVASRRRA